MGALVLVGARALAHDRLRQLPRRRGRGPDPGGIRRGEVRTAEDAQAEVRPGQLLPPEPEHLAGLSDATREGGCACGAVRYRLTSEPMFVHCCHCLNCQRQTGSAFVINLLIEADRVELTGDPQPVDVPRDDGSVQTIYRCPDCQVA